MKYVIVPLLFLFSFNQLNAKPSVKEIGDVLQLMIPAYALGMAVNEKDMTGVKEFIYSYGSSQLLVHSLKLVVRETRPDGSDRRSFPSGHTASAFSGASFIHSRYSLLRAAIPYTMAAFVGYSRIQAKRHYFHDVLAGAGISLIMNHVFTNKYVDVSLTVDQYKTEVGLIYRFH